ncbi:Hypothetical protein NTJ_07310 [Nesidiocoris tenuis]|uniref:Secreted protein n=1 Tax=Nesidiocoris tenuis TaxID=355587 RepID=A0ABN7AUF0_9HEMI|nr:Hypothetical protein NTJ_07310 [Nesidiocoris tenuis]
MRTWLSHRFFILLVGPYPAISSGLDFLPFALLINEKSLFLQRSIEIMNVRSLASRGFGSWDQVEVEERWGTVQCYHSRLPHGRG